MAHTYEYPRPALTADCVIFGVDLEAAELRVLLIERAHDPFAGRWAIPGGFVDPGESVGTAAEREVEEETGLTGIVPEQLHTFSEPGRDPREHVVSVAHFALVDLTRVKPVAGSDARRAEWFDVKRLPRLAFDHAAILKLAIRTVRELAERAPVRILDAAPGSFTLRELRQVASVLLDRDLNPSGFRRRWLASGLLREQTDRGARGATRYRVDQRLRRRLLKA